MEALLRATLERRYRLTVLRTGYPGAARDLARTAARESELVIAVGGDGTVADVASGVLDTDAVIGIIPTGSTNVIARSLGIPLQPARAARTLLRETVVRRFDVAVAADRVVVHIAGCGFDALMMRDVKHSHKRVARWLAYVPAALKHVNAPPADYRITIDGETKEITARMVLVANGSFIIDPWFQVGRNIRSNDGILDVCIYAPPDLWSAFTLSLWFVLGRVYRSRHFAQFRGRHIRIDASPPAAVELDGDYTGTTPLELQLRAGAIPILAPRAAPRWGGFPTIGGDN